MWVVICLNYGDITNCYFHIPLTLYSMLATCVEELSLTSCNMTYVPVVLQLFDDAPEPDAMNTALLPDAYIADALLYKSDVSVIGKSVVGTVIVPIPETCLPPQNSASPLFHLR